MDNNHNGQHELSTLDTATMLKLCLNQFVQILNILSQTTIKSDVVELTKTIQRNEFILTRCLTELGDLGKLKIEALEKIYQDVLKYGEKIKQLQSGGSLVKFITQPRLRSQIDKLSNSIVIAVETLERDLKGEIAKVLVHQSLDELKELLELTKNHVKLSQIGAQQLIEKRKLLVGWKKTAFEAELRIKDKDTRAKIDNELSLLADPTLRRNLFNAIPSLYVKPLTGGPNEASIVVSGHNDEAEHSFQDWICGRSTSAYPMHAISKSRQGDPICDTYLVAPFEHRFISIVCDGCGWGESVQLAAKTATIMFNEYLKQYQHLISRTDEAAVLILRAMKACHEAIIWEKSRDDLMSTGTTTLIGGICLELTTPYQGKTHVFVYGSIGDCKGYVCNNKTGKFVEITKGNRGGADMRDPGGRLGPDDDTKPDLRNVMVSSYFCEDGDILALVTDGVHDNFDPKVMGMYPSEIGINEFEHWPKGLDAKLSAEAVNKISEFSEKEMSKKIGTAKPVTPKMITNGFIQHAMTLTQKLRSMMEESKEKPPDNPRDFPGKLDHVTCVSVQIIGGSDPVPNIGTINLSGSGQLAQSAPWTKATKAVPASNVQVANVNATYNTLSNSPPAQGLSLPCVLEDNADLNEQAFQQLWNKLFGAENFVVSWAVFISGLGITVTKEDENQLKTVIDFSHTNSVTVYKFIEFLKGFGPLENCIENVKLLVGAEWFHGFLGSSDSLKFLEYQPVGTFLVRFSNSRPGAFTLDYVASPGYVRSVRLKNHSSGGFAVQVVGGNEKIFKSIHELVETYTKMNVLVRPFSDSISQKPWFWGDISSEEAQLLLKDEPPGTFLLRFRSPGTFAASFVNEKGEYARGLIQSTTTGYQVGGTGQTFATLDDLIAYYRELKIFTSPLEH